MSPDWFLALGHDPGEGVGCQRVTPSRKALFHGLLWPSKVHRTWDIIKNWVVCEISKQHGDPATHFWEEYREKKVQARAGRGQGRKTKSWGKCPEW